MKGCELLRSDTQTAARDILGIHKHNFKTSPAARRCTGPRLEHIACFVFFQFAGAVHGGRNLATSSRLDRKRSGFSEDGQDICTHLRGGRRKKTSR